VSLEGLKAHRRRSLTSLQVLHLPLDLHHLRLEYHDDVLGPGESSSAEVARRPPYPASDAVSPGQLQIWDLAGTPMKIPEKLADSLSAGPAKHFFLSYVILQGAHLLCPPSHACNLG
jgi:hypothetical protein